MLMDSRNPMPRPPDTIREFIVQRQDHLAREIVARQWKLRPALELRYGPKGMARCLEDAGYHLSYLSEAVGASEPALFAHYVRWAKTMLSARNIPVEDLVVNLEVMLAVLGEELPAPMQLPTLEYVKSAIRDLVLATENPSFLDPSQPLAELAHQYLAALLRYERHAASDLIMRAVENKISIREIYFQVFERCQYEIGRLWESNVVSIGQEHYCTASTQLIMSQLYPYIFRADRTSRGTIVAACVSGELHEIGARMLCDLLEMEGRNTIYLGANVPAAGIVGVLRDNRSNILAVSASMAFHIPAVREVIAVVRSASPTTRILVGGYAFKIAPNLWRDVGADYWTGDASEAIFLISGLDARVGGNDVE
jgi:MerR family transcriptional regulator, light-induced transcriptional regulator